MTTKIEHDDRKGLKRVLVGRTIETVDKEAGTLTLDDGSVLRVKGNDGCWGCASGSFDLEALNHFDNRIMRVKVVETETPDSLDHDTVFEIFVYGAGAKPKAHSLAKVTGWVGNGMYGAGFAIHVVED